MPVYEFACNVCGAAVSVFVRSVNSPVSPKCDCGSTDLRRLVSKFSVARMPTTGLEALDDFDLDSFNDDPQAAAMWARKMQSEMGGELGPEFDDMVERLDRGESLNDLGLGDALGHGHDHGDDDVI